MPAAIIGVNVDGASSSQVPPVGNSGAVGPNHFVQFAIGSFTVYNKSGTSLFQTTDKAFWNAAGITTTITDAGLAEPRVLYDVLSDRWFAIEVNLVASSNRVLLARSDTADPTGAWQAVSFVPTTQYTAFPTLGVDVNGVYIGTSRFPNNSASAVPNGSTMTSIPKIDLVDVAPSLTNKTTVTEGSPVPMGLAPQVVTNPNPTATAASVVATDFSVYNVITYWEITGSGASGASFGTPVDLAISYNALPGDSRQPDGTRDMSSGEDDRYSGAMYQVGDLIYAVHAISVNSSGVGMDYVNVSSATTNAVQIVVIRDSTNTKVAETTYFDARYDYTFSSIAANQFGDIIIGLNRSGGSGSPNGNLGACAVHYRINPANPTSLTFLQEVVLQNGLENDYNLTQTVIEPWGPYSATSLDPSNPFAFWTTQQYVKGTTEWGTKISQVYVSPRALSVDTGTANGTYSMGVVIPITVTFNGPVTVNGFPVLNLNSGGTAVYASGSGTNTLTFNYTVSAGQSSLDLDYTSTSPIDLSGGSINLTGASTAVPAELVLPAPGTSGSLGFSHAIVINALVPTVTSVTSSKTNGTYGLGTLIPITITLGRAANVTNTPTLALNSGGIATYASGSGTTTLTFNYTVAAGHSSGDLNYSSINALSLGDGTITDAVNGSDAILTLPATGSANSLGGSKDIVVDALPPVVTGITSPVANGTYNFGAVIAISVGFNKAVDVTGLPQLTLNSGAVVDYSGGSGTTSLTFDYTVGAGQTSADLDYTSSTALALNDGTILEVGTGLIATLTLPSPGAAGSLGANKNIVIDTTQARVTNVTSTTANGLYKVGDTIDIQVQFDRLVNVMGSPQMALNSAGIANYASGSGTSTLVFSYVVAVGDSNSDLDYTSTTALALNSGTIRDATELDANILLPTPGTMYSLGFNKNIAVDAVGPSVLEYRLLFGSKRYNILGSSRFDYPWRVKGIQVVFDENVTTGTRQSLTGLSAISFSGKNTKTLTWKFGAVSKGSFNTGLVDSGATALRDASGNSIASFTQAFQVLYGDFDANGVVNGADETAVRLNLGRPYSANPSGYNIFADLSGDGLVSLIDVGITKSRKGKSLP